MARIRSAIEAELRLSLASAKMDSMSYPTRAFAVMLRWEWGGRPGSPLSLSLYISISLYTCDVY